MKILFWTKEEKVNKLFEDVDVDIWVMNKIDYNRTVFYNNIEFGDVLSVVKKKMDMKREKDYKSLVDYINQLTYFTR